MELYATELMGSKAYDLQGNYVGTCTRVFHRARGPTQSYFPFSADARPFSSAGSSSRPDRFRCGWRDSP